ncbi:MAG: sodium:proton antiporter [Desulfocapsaceae bacterium]
MDLFDIITVLVVLAAIFSYINHRFFGLPRTIGLMALSLLVSLSLLGLGSFGIVTLDEQVAGMLTRLDFYDTLMHGMLGFLLFAGALHVNFQDLREMGWVILLLATFGVIASTVLVGFFTWGILMLVGMALPLIYCFLFGALISPTDPIAVLGILKKAQAPKQLETKITGESLFNDGIGVVVFLTLLSLMQSGPHAAEPFSIAKLLAVEAGGGILYGIGLGYIAYSLIKRIDNYHVEILLTLATVMGGYRFAEAIHVSAPLAIVVAGLMVGNHGRYLGMSDLTREHLDTFWELIDEILNAVLFVLIGLELLVISHTLNMVTAGLLLIPCVLLARFVSVGSIIGLMRRFSDFPRGSIRIMTWAGLRGGISVALALSLPLGPERDLLVTITYCIMTFSILVQGLTVGHVVRYFYSTSSANAHQVDANHN